MTVNDGVGTGRYRIGSALELGISFEKENERLMQEAAADAADTDAITLSTYGTYRRKPAMMHRSAHPKKRFRKIRYWLIAQTCDIFSVSTVVVSGSVQP